jgi:hypothetical protein
LPFADTRGSVGGMSQPQISESKPQHPSGRSKAKPRGRPFEVGNRANPEGRRLKSRRFAELYASLCEDMGGEACLNALQRTVLAQAVRVLLRAQRERRPEDVVRLSNCAACLMATVQSGRMNPRVAAPAPPKSSLQEHLAKLSAQGRAADDGAA